MEVYPGNIEPLGCKIQKDRVNFAVFSHTASKITLGIKMGEQIQEIPLNRTGHIWHAEILGWKASMEYAFCIEKGKWLADPYSTSLRTSKKWGQGIGSVFSKLEDPLPFDWENAKKPKIPIQDLIIYEMHIRGFTMDKSGGVLHPGTFLGMIDKIPYLKTLGVNAVEFLPIFEFDETTLDMPLKGNLVNYWGYDPMHYFHPMQRYAATDDVKGEFKTLVRELHKNGIEVILDVVYNHTGEWAYPFSFLGLDEPAYYMVDENGKWLNFTGCKNTVNANHPATMELILASLRYWTEEMQVDGFRFDLASILTRGQNGHVLKNPPLLEAIENDPLLREAKLISEAWDATGLYQVGQFPLFGPWSEWNGRYRDYVRVFLKGTDGFVGKFADVFSGSQFLYHGYGPTCSINFITAHDGFCLRDLVSYDHKYNQANGHSNHDGCTHNDSWNSGAEGNTNDPKIIEIRGRRMRNFLLALFLSQGVPMILMGDEYGHTRNGNNNPYTQDNGLNWFLWDQIHQDQLGFVSSLIAFRKKHPELRRTEFLTKNDIDWHGINPGKPNWNPESHFIACTLKGKNQLYIAFNSHNHEVQIQLPEGSWKEVVRSEKDWKDHFLNKDGPVLPPSLTMPSFSAILAIQP